MKINQLRNIFEILPDKLNEELFDEILSADNFKLERIISEGQTSPRGFWYDQDKNEFVLLLSGSAELSYDDGRIFSLKTGDYLIIPPHQKHRVEKTDDTVKTFWLALHY